MIRVGVERGLMPRNRKGQFTPARRTAPATAARRRARRFRGINLGDAVAAYLTLDAVSIASTNITAAHQIRNLLRGTDAPQVNPVRGTGDAELRELLRGDFSGFQNLGPLGFIPQTAPIVLTRLIAASAVPVAKRILKRPRAQLNKVLRQIGAGDVVRV